MAALLAAAAAGCDDRKDAPVTAETKGPAEVVASGPLASLEAPPTVLLFGGTQSPEALVRRVAALAPGGSMLTAAEIARGIQTKFKLSDPGALDLSKPVRFAVVEPKKHKEPMALCVGTKGRDAFAAALPATKKAGEGGNAYRYEIGEGKTAYVGFIDDFAVLTESPQLFADARAFLTKLLGAAVSGEGAFVVSVTNAATMYRAEIEQGLGELRKQVAEGAKASPLGGGAQATALGAMEWLKQTLADIDRAHVVLAAVEDGVRASAQLRPKAGSGFEKSMKLLEGGRPLPLLAKLPPKSLLVAAVAVDPERAAENLGGVLGWGLRLGVGTGGTEPEKLAAVDEAMRAYWKGTTGEWATLVVPSASALGVDIASIAGVRDAEAVRGALAKLRAHAAAKELAGLYEALGVKASVKEAAYRVGSVAVDTVTAEAAPAKDASPRAPMDPARVRAAGAESDPLRELVLDVMSSHTAVGAEQVVIALGRQARPLVEAVMGGKLEGGLDKTPGLGRARAAAAPGQFLLLYVQPVDLLKRLKLDGTSLFGGKLDAVPPSEMGIALSAGAKDGGLELVLDVPAEQGRAVLGLFALSQRGR
jgi:hypothetical protein